MFNFNENRLNRSNSNESDKSKIDLLDPEHKKLTNQTLDKFKDFYKKRIPMNKESFPNYDSKVIEKDIAEAARLKNIFNNNTGKSQKTKGVYWVIFKRI